MTLITQAYFNELLVSSSNAVNYKIFHLYLFYGFTGQILFHAWKMNGSLCHFSLMLNDLCHILDWELLKQEDHKGDGETQLSSQCAALNLGKQKHAHNGIVYNTEKIITKLYRRIAQNSPYVYNDLH